MSNLTISQATVPAISAETLVKVDRLEQLMLQEQQVSIDTEHLIHGGMYARTIRVPAGFLFTSALVKRASILIVNGPFQVLISEGVTADLEGYNVIPASAGRKQVYLARGPLELTAIFLLKAETTAIDPRQAVAEAEAEVTDDAVRLASRRQGNNDIITITGE